MAVKKVVKSKDLQTAADSGSIDLSSNLDAVKKAILTLPTDEEIMNQETAAATETKAAKKSAPKKVTKKAAAPQVKEKKASAPAKDSNEVSLAALCKQLKVEPSTARRILRNAEIESPGSRWAWKAGSRDLTAVTKLLTPAK